MAATIELSRREREVAGLVAEGLTNREIAERLFISERTAEGHVEQILNKLGFGKRTQIAAWIASGQGKGPPAAPLSTVPRPITQLVGRAAEIETVTEALRISRLVTVTGPGGIGKTRVAVEAGARLEDSFRDGAWFVELDSVADRDSVPGAVALALKIPQPPAQAVEASLLAHLARRDALLIVDNCEHVIEACRELLRALLSRAGGVRVLATSRELLGVPGERVVALQPLEIASDAVELFAQRCGELGTTERIQGQQALVASICGRLDGIPLAIELAAAQTPALPLARIAERLDDRRVLKGTAHASSPRHQALETALDWSYQLLPTDEADAFRRLSAFRGGIALDAAEAVLGDRPTGQTPIDLVSALIRKSLLVPRDEPSGDRRYHMLETLREFAARRLESSGDSGGAKERHAQFFLDLATAAFVRIRTSDSDSWVRRLDLERGNLNAALEHLAGARDGRFTKLVSALGRYWIRGRVEDGFRWTEQAIRANHLEAIEDLHLLEAWAWLTWQAARSGPAFDALDLMLEGALRANDHASAGRALNMIATFRHDQKMSVDPELWRRAEIHLRRAGDDWALALLLNDIGFFAAVEGHPDMGLPKITEALGFARRAGDGWLVALILDSLAWAYAELGEVEPAIRSWAEGISMTVAAADRYPLPNYLEGFARIARIEGDPSRAVVLLAAAAGVRGGIGARALEVWADYLRQDVDFLRAALGAEEFDACWRLGVEMSAEEAVQYALTRVESTATAPDPTRH